MKESNIEINLIGQKQSYPRYLNLALGLFWFVFLIVIIVIPELTFRVIYLIWIIFLPGFFGSVFYRLGKLRRFKNIFPFLRIDHIRLSINRGGFMSKTKTFYWENVHKIEVKLFELIIKSNDCRLDHVDLNSLTDENLKAVKELVSTIKEEKGI